METVFRQILYHRLIDIGLQRSPITSNRNSWKLLGENRIRLLEATDQRHSIVHRLLQIGIVGNLTISLLRRAGFPDREVHRLLQIGIVGNLLVPLDVQVPPKTVHRLL